MYQTLAGQISFDGKLVHVLKQIIKGEPRPPSQFNPGLARQLEAICLKVTAKNPEDRFSSAFELADALHGR